MQNSNSCHSVERSRAAERGASQLEHEQHHMRPVACIQSGRAAIRAVLDERLLQCGREQQHSQL